MRISALLAIHRQVLLGSILPAVFLLELVCLPHLSQASFGFFGTETTGPRNPTQTHTKKVVCLLYSSVDVFRLYKLIGDTEGKENS